MARKFTATYQPYTFEELMRPVDRYEKAYDELEKQLDDLEVQNEVLNRLDQELDKYAYEKNKAQQDRLLGVSEEMSSRGLNPSMRQTIAEMRRYQRRELNPLISAYKERENLIKEQRAKGDNYIFDKKYSETPLEDMLTGTNTYSAYNLDDALKEGMMSGKAISSRIYGNPQLSRELKNQYFKMTQGIPLDGRTVDQLFDDYPELQDDFTNWYGSNFSGSGFTEGDLDRAKQKYMSGVLRGIVYNEDYKTNQDHWTPQAWDNKLRHDRAEARELDKNYGMVINDNGDRGKDAGNGVILITPANSNSASGYSQPYWAKKDANGDITRISDDEAASTINKGTYMGKDIDGNPLYNNGKGIVTYDKDDPQKIKGFQTFKDASNGEEATPDKNPDNGKPKDYAAFKEFNFDSYAGKGHDSSQGSFKPGVTGGYGVGHPKNSGKNGSHDRENTREALANGYEIVDYNSLSWQCKEGILDVINKKFKANLEPSDLVILKRSRSSGDDHYRVVLRPDLYDRIYGEGSSPLWGIYNNSISSSSRDIPPGDLNQQITNPLQRIVDSLRTAAGNRYGRQQ